MTDNIETTPAPVAAQPAPAPVATQPAPAPVAAQPAPAPVAVQLEPEPAPIETEEDEYVPVPSEPIVPKAFGLTEQEANTVNEFAARRDITNAFGALVHFLKA